MKDDNFIKENNAKHLWHPMGHPADSLANPPKVIVSAKNSSIIDMDGHTAIDAVGGLWCVNLGYSNTAVKDAIANQVYELPYYSSFAGTTNGPAIEASLAVREMFGADGMSRVFFTSGGSDAVETSLRLARQYQVARRTWADKVYFVKKRLSRYALWRRLCQWQQPVPDKLRTFASRLFSSSESLYVSQSI